MQSIIFQLTIHMQSTTHNNSRFYDFYSQHYIFRFVKKLAALKLIPIQEFENKDIITQTQKMKMIIFIKFFGSRLDLELIQYKK